jgi:hypothetical protein
MTCNLCHSPEGHTELCATLIMTPWQSTESVHNELAMAFLEVLSNPKIDVGLSRENLQSLDVSIRTHDYAIALWILRTHLDT